MTRRVDPSRYESALAAEWAGLPFQRSGVCVDCQAFGYVRGRTSTVVRCFPCHCDSPAVRRRAKRRSLA